MEKVIIYSNGLVHCSVCADKELDLEDVEHLVNKKNTTGTTSEWKIKELNFKDGSANPHKCENDEQRLHYLLTC